MPLEIERKFLLKSLPTISPDDSIEIEQIYQKRFGTWERVRSWKSLNNDTTKWIHTIKKPISKGVSNEIEKIISETEFNSFKDLSFDPKLQTRTLYKIRHLYQHNNLIWEIDEFLSDYKLVVAEVELPKQNFKLQIPNFISNLILMEVTGLKQFSNRSLSIPVKEFIHTNETN